MVVAARKENPAARRDGQSVFALLRGKTFEARLIAEDATTLLESLQKAEVISSTSTDFEDHRVDFNGGPLSSLDEAIETGTQFHQDLANGIKFDGAI